MEALMRGQKIEAIKIVRQEQGVGLKEAKDAVEVYLASRPDVAGQLQSANLGIKRVVLLVVLVALALFLFMLFRRA